MNADAEEPVLRVQGLRFGWGNAPLFDQLSFELPPGVSLVRGGDGSGKSTLLQLLAGAQNADAGVLAIHGIRLDLQRDAYRHQVFWIDPQTEAHDALAAKGYLDSLSHHYPHFSVDTMRELAEGFGLGPHLAKPMYMLSTGSRRKVWLTAAFAAGTPLTLIDQPFSALDAPSIRFLRELLGDAADHPSRAWLLADHEAPEHLALKKTIDV
ncbi:MAG: ATP-binding cassette domain-containing protein [Hydrogenophaga sp.]|jgi:ABC-type multidrug transport system ATPase subunit|uniref:ABC transporter ATP-binding protein n=1 Tax=Hydrogenophaga sp. TaxID=1904254 RepID=UPI001D73968F|nr:ATP-binding cassette domain-containing protein [Hydrogenophaga sp.]MBW0172779.1 ATP-binding cassette domain-containing protein [Hydrogenophaga sp.]MBW0185697.1 ATP-binding cassette domain-containing protein [Hydrogenophaga sp.]